MTNDPSIKPWPNKLWIAMLWILRVTVVLQSLGNWRLMTQIEETSLLHWMLNPTDVGGLAWSEATAFALQQYLGWAVLVAACLVLLRPYVVVLGFLAAVQTLSTIAMWQIADGYAVVAPWAPSQLLELFPFATQAARIAAPLGLMLLVSSKADGAQNNRRNAHTMQLLRWSIAIVFLAHGIEAWQHNPRFIDLLINSSQRIGETGMSQATAEHFLTVIGILDMVVAAVCVSVRSVAVLYWMAIWGGITALSRWTAFGWQLSWHEVVTRGAHLGVPLAVALWWLLLRWRQAEPLQPVPNEST